MIRIAICDDSPAFLQQTKFLIQHWDSPVARNIAIELFEDGDTLLLAHAKSPFDIIFLDIVMPLLNGIDAAKELREKDTTVKIVFLTCSAEFAVDSYSVKASNYLLKPVSPDSLFACLEDLTDALQSSPKYIIVKSLDSINRVTLQDIEHMEAQGKHVVFYLKGNRTLESPEPFYTFENTLTLDEGFHKCHRSYIVNIHHIDTYTHAEIIMHSGRRVPIARSCQKSFESSYFKVVFGKVGDEI